MQHHLPVSHHALGSLILVKLLHRVESPTELESATAWVWKVRALQPSQFSRISAAGQGPSLPAWHGWPLHTSPFLEHFTLEVQVVPSCQSV